MKRLILNDIPAFLLCAAIMGIIGGLTWPWMPWVMVGRLNAQDARITALEAKYSKAYDVIATAAPVINGQTVRSDAARRLDRGELPHVEGTP